MEFLFLLLLPCFMFLALFHINAKRNGVIRLDFCWKKKGFIIRLFSMSDDHAIGMM